MMATSGAPTHALYGHCTLCVDARYVVWPARALILQAGMDLIPGYMGACTASSPRLKTVKTLTF